MHTLEHCLYQIAITSCHDGIISLYILTLFAKRRQFEYLTTLRNTIMNIINRSGPRIDPCGTMGNTSYCVESATAANMG
jgi:hypothetical protein